jgi:hypothetical protein
MGVSLVTAVSLYGPKPAPLQRLLESLQATLAGRLGPAFAPYTLEQVHGTLIILAGMPDGSVPGAVLNQYFLEYRGLRTATDFDRVQQLLRRHLTPPLTIRIGGFGPADPVPFSSRGQHLNERSFSAQAGTLVLAGWPVSSLCSAGASRPLDELRRGMTEAGVLHRYHRAPSDIDDDFHLVVGTYAGAERAAVEAAILAVRQDLAREPIEVQVGIDQVRIIASDSPTLAAPRFCARLPVAAAQVAGLYR